MATGKAFSAAEEESIIKARFLTGAAVSKGEPPFRKLVKKFVELVENVEGGSTEAAEKAFKAFLRETTNVEYQAQKYAAICTAQQKEQESYVRKQQLLQQHIEQAKKDIEDKKQELQQARLERQHMEEYELLRGMIAELPERATTQGNIDKVKSQMDRIQDQGRKHATIMDRKRKQYALLFHVLDELQRLNDDDDTQQPGGQQAQQPTAAAAVSTPGAMDVDS